MLIIARKPLMPWHSSRKLGFCISSRLVSQYAVTNGKTPLEIGFVRVDHCYSIHSVIRTPEWGVRLGAWLLLLYAAEIPGNAVASRKIGRCSE